MNKKCRYVFFSVALASIMMTGCKGSFSSVKQASTTLEAGTKINLASCISYNPDDIKSAKVVDDGGFNNKVPGTYNVIYKLTNVKNKDKNFSFEYSVVDTTKPTINVNDKKIYIKKHDDFSIENYVEAKDNSSDVEIRVDGKVDPEKEGTYDVKVYAVDGSQNKSEQKDLEIIVENRDDCDFRNAKFGDDPETVKRYETAEKVEENLLSDDGANYLIYEAKINDIDCGIFYFFNNNNQLYKTLYKFGADHVNNNEYINDYYNIKELLEKKYGNPEMDIRDKNSLAAYCVDEAQAITLGYEKMISTWNLDNYSIINYIQSDDDYGINHSIAYESTKIDFPEKDTSDF